MLYFLVGFPFAAGILLYGAGKMFETKAASGSPCAHSAGEFSGMQGTRVGAKAVSGSPCAHSAGGDGDVQGDRKERLRDWGAAAAVLAELAAALWALWAVASPGIEAPVWSASLPELCGMGLNLTLDGFRALYTAIAAFMWAVSTIFSTEYMRSYRNRDRYYLFLLVTLGATVGIFLSADLFTTFLFFEVMSMASYVWVAQDERQQSLRAAQTYLAVAVIGGMVLLMGLFLLYNGTGTLMISELPAACAVLPEGVKWAAGLCMLFGFGAKAGAFPLHIWLPKAHPVAPAPASALLSGILTKAGIFGILVLSLWVFAGTAAWGLLILGTGTVTMVLGAVLALFSVDLKRTLACSSISQIGFILVGIGTAVLLGAENGLALKGTMLHMVNHSLIKLVLFCAAGVVYQNLHRLDLNEIQGFGRKKPFLAVLFLAGAISIAGIPLGSGYVSKTLLHEGLVEYRELLEQGARSIAGLQESAAAGLLSAVEWLFLFSGGLTLAYMCKLGVALFLEKNEDAGLQEKYDGMKNYLGLPTRAGLGIIAALLAVMGLFPGVIMDGMAGLARGFLRHEEALPQVSYFSMGNLSGALISIVIGLVCYFTAVRLWMHREGKYVNRWDERLDLEERVYRPLLLVVLNTVFTVIFRFLDRLLDSLVVGMRRSVYRDSPLPHELDEGTVMTHVMGVVLDDGKKVLNHTLYKKHPLRVSFEHKLALLQSELSESNTIIGRSLSFGLLLFCAGLLATLIYMLFF